MNTAISKASERYRCFIALPVLGTARDQCCSAQQNHRHAVPVDNLHLTLTYLSTISVDQIEAVKYALRTICRRHRPFKLTLDRAETMASEVGHIFVAVPRPSLEIDRLHNDIHLALNDMNIDTSLLAWRPHITLARPASMPAQNWHPVVMPVQSVVLYKSIYQRAAASHYEPLQCCSLADS